MDNHYIFGAATREIGKTAGLFARKYACDFEGLYIALVLSDKTLGMRGRCCHMRGCRWDDRRDDGWFRRLLVRPSRS